MVMDAPVSVTPEVAEGPTDAGLVAAVRRGDDRVESRLPHHPFIANLNPTPTRANPPR